MVNPTAIEMLLEELKESKKTFNGIKNIESTHTSEINYAENIFQIQIMKAYSAGIQDALDYETLKKVGGDNNIKRPTPIKYWNKIFNTKNNKNND